MRQYSLRELRARKNMTQREVANILGISYQTYSNWEKDISGIAVSKVYRLAQFYGVTLDELVILPIV